MCFLVSTSFSFLFSQQRCFLFIVFPLSFRAGGGQGEKREVRVRVVEREITCEKIGKRGEGGVIEVAATSTARKGRSKENVTLARATALF